MLNDAITVFHPGNPRLEKDSVEIPMPQLGIDEMTSQVMCSIDVKLGDGVGDSLELGDDAEGLKVLI